jgi:hypothetical protein
MLLGAKVYIVVNYLHGAAASKSNPRRKVRMMKQIALTTLAPACGNYARI